MTPEEINAAVTVATVLVNAAFAIAAILGMLYVVWIYRQRREEAKFLERLVRRDIRVGLAATAGLIYLGLAVAGYGLGRPWGAVLLSAIFASLLWGPTDDAILWFKERREEARLRRQQ